MTIHFDDYDRIIVAFSGGKDSIACLLHLFELNVDRSKIELWHHDVDGREGSRLMDWPVTRSYCEKFAEHFGVPIYFSWREGGFEREMLRLNTATAGVYFETPEQGDPEFDIDIKGLMKVGGRSTKASTRRKFPQVSADLSVRWCSPYLKIDVASMAINNSTRLDGRRTLFITGERAEESPARAKYKTFEPHRTHGRKRHVDHWRPVHAWAEEDVWNIIELYNIVPHPGYRLGWGRLSCMKCIFGSPDQCASARHIDPDGYHRIVNYEEEFGVTIHRSENYDQRADRGKVYDMDPDLIRLAMSDDYYGPILTNDWTLPKGAFGDKAGPC